MAALFLALVALLPALASAQVASLVAGGATSVSSLMSGTGGLYANCPTGDLYGGGGSGKGIDNFIAGTWAIGCSDAPMTPVDEARVNGNGKATIPFVLARYSFYVNTVKKGGGTVPKVRLNAVLSIKIYQGKYANWAKVSALYKLIDAVTITRFARGEPTGSGTTQILKSYWLKGARGFFGNTPINPDPLPPATFPGYIGVIGTTAMCNSVAGRTGSIGYAQVGVCDVIARTAGVKINEVLLQNKAGKFILASTADAAASAPRQPPGFAASWSTIPDKMILQTGPKTPAISSFVYAFIRLRNSGAGGAKAQNARTILGCWLTKQQSIATAFFFTPLPTKIRISAAGFVTASTS